MSRNRVRCVVHVPVNFKHSSLACPRALHNLKKQPRFVLLYNIELHYILQQLKTHIQTIDDLQSQVEVSDHGKFVSLTQGTRHDVQRAIEEFGMVQATYTSNEEDEEQQFDQLTTVSDQSVLIPREEAAAQSWEELRKVRLLNSCVAEQYYSFLQDLLELNELTRALQMEVNVSIVCAYGVKGTESYPLYSYS